MPKRWIPEDKHVVGGRPGMPRGAVKSAARVLQILEYLDEMQRPAQVVEISRMLGLPQSSTSVLLGTLVDMGYLHCDRAARSYWPSVKVALLGSWVARPYFASGIALEFADDLNRQTGDAVVLATRRGIWAQYIHVVQARSTARLHMTRGALRPLAASGVGYALLSLEDDAFVRDMVHRHNAEAPSHGLRSANADRLLRTLEEVRRAGHAFTANLHTPGGSVVAATLPIHDNGLPLAAGIAGIAEVQKVRREPLANLLLASIRKHFGSDRRGSPSPQS